MIFLLAGAAAGIIALTQKSGASVPGSNNSRVAKATNIATRPQLNKNPSSAQSKGTKYGPDSGNSANQPWYNGPLVAAGGIAAVEIAKGLGGLLQSAGSAPITPAGSPSQGDSIQSEDQAVDLNIPMDNASSYGQGLDQPDQSYLVLPDPSPMSPPPDTSGDPVYAEGYDDSGTTWGDL